MVDVAQLHPTERKIILKLIHSPTRGFNELWAKDGESNAFAYHVNKLESLGVVVKRDDGDYSLTEEGKRLSAFVEGDTGMRAEFPTFSTVLVVRKGKNFLAQKRLKEPFYGLWSFVSGKINFGFNLFECASRDLLEETGLAASDWRMRAVEMVKTIDKRTGKLLFHHYLFFVETENPAGEVKVRTHKAEHAWMSLDEYKAMERFPGEHLFEVILPSKRPVLLEVERYMEDGSLVGSKTTGVLPL